MSACAEEYAGDVPGADFSAILVKIANGSIVPSLTINEDHDLTFYRRKALV
jgi:hypothetical protein